jgi:hypothetical protein
MFYKILADIIVIIHLAFIVFVLVGGFLILKWPRIIWIHIPVFFWGAIVEFTGWICPLTPWENHFRRLAGVSVYEGDFVGNYILPVIYPEELTRNVQIVLGSLVVSINLLIYTLVLIRAMRKRRSGPLF